jgi:hypothetical protein
MPYKIIFRTEVSRNCVVKQNLHFVVAADSRGDLSWRKKIKGEGEDESSFHSNLKKKSEQNIKILLRKTKSSSKGSSCRPK